MIDSRFAGIERLYGTGSVERLSPVRVAVVGVGGVGSWAAEALARGDVEELAAYQTRAPGMPYAHPTPDHYLPLLYVLGASDESDAVTFPVEGMDGGSISMLSVQFG